jgi:GNAT superfamily N-acetyltransferase
MSIEIKLLASGDSALLESVAAGVFDRGISASLAKEFLRDPRHHLTVAIDDAAIVGFASGVHYVHPDKAPQMFINEVGIAPTHRGRGIGRAVLNALIRRARDLNCSEAWVLTCRENPSAMRMYASLGGREEANTPVMFTFPLGTDGFKDLDGVDSRDATGPAD